MPSTMEDTTAAPTPCTKRAAVSSPSLGARPAQHRSDGEDGDAGQEQAAASEQVAEAAGEEEQTAEADQVAVDDPGERRLVGVEAALDRRQGDVHDRRVEHDHQLAEAEHDECDPPPGCC